MLYVKKNKKEGVIMAKFLLELPHEEEKLACARSIKLLLETGSHLLTKVEWGCDDGEHKGWVIVELDNKEEARSIIPYVMRSDARIVQLNKYTLEEVEEVIRSHQSQE
jgi:hypothetical protein